MKREELLDVRARAMFLAVVFAALTLTSAAALAGSGVAAGLMIVAICIGVVATCDNSVSEKSLYGQEKPA